MGTPSPADTVLKACQWVQGVEALQTHQPNYFDWLACLEQVRLAKEDVWCFPVCFSADLDGPLGDFLQVTLSVALGGSSDDEETLAVAETLNRCLVALLISSPSPLESGHLQVFLSLSRQSAGVLCGVHQEERFRSLIVQFSALDAAGTGRVRRQVVRRLVQALRSAMGEVRTLRPRLNSRGVLEQMEACPLVFSHSQTKRQGLACFVALGAELGIEVDGQMLRELDIAVVTSIHGLLKKKGPLAQRLSERFGGGPIQSACLPGADLELVLAGLQKNLSLRELRRAGVEKSRAKNLLTMKCTESLFAIYRRLVFQLRSFDVLAAWAEQVVPIQLSQAGFSSPLGPLSPQVAWAFRVPRLAQVPRTFSRVQLQMGGLLEVASKRDLRDQGQEAIGAVWSVWESLVQEAEAVGGLAILQGRDGVVVFEDEQQATAFSRSAKGRFKVPIALPVGQNRPPLLLTGVAVPVAQAQAELFGGWDGAVALLWGPVVGHAEPPPQESEREGFSILTEVIAPEVVDSPQEEPTDSFQVVDGSQVFEDESASTLDNFFLPAKQVRKACQQGLSLGLSLDDLVDLFRGYRQYGPLRGEWVFGRPEKGQMMDRHVYSGDLSVVEAVKCFLLDKYKEGFSPRSDLAGPVPPEVQMNAISRAILGRALEEIEEGKGE